MQSDRSKYALLRVAWSGVSVGPNPSTANAAARRSDRVPLTAACGGPPDLPPLSVPAQKHERESEREREREARAAGKQRHRETVRHVHNAFLSIEQMII